MVRTCTVFSLEALFQYQDLVVTLVSLQTFCILCFYKEHPTSNDKKDTSQKQTQTGGDTSGYVLGERDDEEEEEVLRKPHQGRGVEGTDSKVETGRHRADVAQRLQKQHNPRQSVMAGISLKTSLLDSVGVGNLESRVHFQSCYPNNSQTFKNACHKCAYHMAEDRISVIIIINIIILYLCQMMQCSRFSKTTRPYRTVLACFVV